MPTGANVILGTTGVRGDSVNATGVTGRGSVVGVVGLGQTGDGLGVRGTGPRGGMFGVGTSPRGVGYSATADWPASVDRRARCSPASASTVRRCPASAYGVGEVD